MSKRIFTKRFMGTVAYDSGPPPDIGFNAIDSWLAQEDIEVLGAAITVVPDSPSENDGYTWCAIELSQVGIYGQDGAILQAVAMEGWNTTPAGISVAVGNMSVSFPDGEVIPVREEGILYINSRGYGKSAGQSGYSYSVTVYYTKKGTRRTRA
ncbi:hypothetical protein ES705_34702 [subsurface metagenome]